MVSTSSHSRWRRIRLGRLPGMTFHQILWVRDCKNFEKLHLLKDPFIPGRNNHNSPNTMNNGNLYSEVPISTSPMFANRWDFINAAMSWQVALKLFSIRSGFMMILIVFFLTFSSTRSYGNNYVNHISPSNDNVTYGNAKDYTLGFAYLNDLDRSDVETTTEL